MRRCYEEIWRNAVQEAMADRFPEFSPYLPSEPEFEEWDILPASLVFRREARPDLCFEILFSPIEDHDEFFGSFSWENPWERDAALPVLVDSQIAYSDGVIALPKAHADLQGLAAWKENAGSDTWKIWTPKASIDDPMAWMAEVKAEEAREIGEEEARLRVELAVHSAMNDVECWVLPWFNAKLAWQGRQVSGCLAA